MNRAADWFKQAERDLAVAETNALNGYHEWAAFAAQQCGEKAVKALIQSLHGSVRGHGIAKILRQLPATLKVADEVMSAGLALDKVYVNSRDPNAFSSGSPGDYFTEHDSKELIQHARTVLEFCRSQIH